MINDYETIKLVLSKADNLFCYDVGDERVMLVYDNGRLVRSNPFGGLANKPISDVKKIIFHDGPKAWEVIWKV